MHIKSSIIEQPDQSYNLLYLDLEAIVKLLGEGNHLRSEDKLTQELWTTYLFSLLLKSDSIPIAGIGLPIRGDIRESDISLELIADCSYHCPEYDTVIFLEGGESLGYYKIQNVKYTKQKSADTRMLFDFLKDRHKQANCSSGKLYLLLNIEQRIIFDYQYFNEVLSSLSVPFDGIYAIGHQGRDENLKFVGIKIYPEVDGPIRIDTGVLADKDC